jgi:hypothetical protein
MQPLLLVVYPFAVITSTETNLSQRLLLVGRHWRPARLPLNALSGESESRMAMRDAASAICSPPERGAFI